VRREELYLADLIDNARAVRGYLDGVTRERWDADGMLRDAVLYRMLFGKAGTGDHQRGVPGTGRQIRAGVRHRVLPVIQVISSGVTGLRTSSVIPSSPQARNTPCAHHRVLPSSLTDPAFATELDILKDRRV